LIEQVRTLISLVRDRNRSCLEDRDLAQKHLKEVRVKLNELEKSIAGFVDSRNVARAVALSTVTCNSLVVLPLDLAVPGAVPILSTIIVTQTLVELLSKLVCVRFTPKVMRDREALEPVL
jgi:hypothetical protein